MFNAINKDKDYSENERWFKSEIMHLLDICIDSSNFSFRNQYLKQVKGTPMVLLFQSFRNSR